MIRKGSNEARTFDALPRLPHGTCGIPGVLGRSPTSIISSIVLIIDHTAVPMAIAAKCNGLKHDVFLGTAGRSYANPEKLEQHSNSVHTIKGYGNTVVAGCAIVLMWASARSLVR